MPAASNSYGSSGVHDGSAVIVVRNGGEPIPEHRLVTFFDKFNTTKADSGGTGLGTSYAKLVLKAHGGGIWVSSSAEEGTKVTISLPVV